ncbi:class I SAM-dependent methyltransferase [Candidatus Bathyarchaeota archaeon]|nr:class I SAM-dependent methyltransferase [Candidatus Bathyarchaeota archaeon]
MRRIIENLYFYLPFSRINVVWQKLDKQKSHTILDVGCGIGLPMRGLRKHQKFSTVGIDLLLPHLKECHQMRVHDDYILCDARFLPIRKKTFDIVLCLELIEHLPKNDSEMLMNKIEEIARIQVIISTPVGFHHGKSGWTPIEFEQKGYKLRGITGLRCLNNEMCKSTFLQQSIVFNLISYLSNFLAYFVPNFAHCMLAVKKAGATGLGRKDYEKRAHVGR